MSEQTLGQMSDDRWTTLAQQLVELQLIKPNLDVRGAYRLQFLGESAESAQRTR